MCLLATKETSTSTLELFSEPKGEKAMARTVGLTCGIATQLLLDGHGAIKKPGIWAPYDVEACEVIRDVLEGECVVMAERVI
jgi:saccharopine dehydrogenase (NADP+, L-glutamate forming)